MSLRFSTSAASAASRQAGHRPFNRWTPSSLGMRTASSRCRRWMWPIVVALSAAIALNTVERGVHCLKDYHMGRAAVGITLKMC